MKLYKTNIARLLYKNSSISEKMRQIVFHLRLYYPYNIWNMYQIRHASPMLNHVVEARRFFDENKGRVDDICSWLEDKKSEEVYRKLIRLRQFYEVKDIPAYNYFDQYFPRDIPEFSAKWGGNAVFVDCGAFNGDIDIIFAKKARDYSKIYAFEPDRTNIEALEKRGQHIRNLEIIKAACSDYQGFVEFSEQEQSGGSHIALKDDVVKILKVPCTTIDTVVGNGRCDFIKMDIEGAEWQALHGAVETIKRCKPKLAISIYHSAEDMIRLPQYIHSIVPEYRLYIRAHTMGIAETILYAMI